MHTQTKGSAEAEPVCDGCAVNDAGGRRARGFVLAAKLHVDDARVKPPVQAIQYTVMGLPDSHAAVAMAWNTLRPSKVTRGPHDGVAGLL